MSDDMKVSKGLEFPVVALPGVGHMPAAGEDEQEAARATQRLVIGAGGRCEIRGKIMKSAESDVILKDLTPAAVHISTAAIRRHAHTGASPAHA